MHALGDETTLLARLGNNFRPKQNAERCSPTRCPELVRGFEAVCLKCACSGVCVCVLSGLCVFPLFFFF